MSNEIVELSHREWGLLWNDILVTEEKLEKAKNRIGILEIARDLFKDELARAEEGWYLANGVADLAMKHRDIAEKQLDIFKNWMLEGRMIIEDITLDEAMRVS